MTVAAFTKYKTCHSATTMSSRAEGYLYHGQRATGLATPAEHETNHTIELAGKQSWSSC